MQQARRFATGLRSSNDYLLWLLWNYLLWLLWNALPATGRLIDTHDSSRAGRAGAITHPMLHPNLHVGRNPTTMPFARQT